MKIGTWNLAGRWTDRHQDALVSANCDVWLLTEVSDRMALPGQEGHRTSAEMRPKVRWAGVFSRCKIELLPDPHPASAMAHVNGVTFVSSILPWSGSGNVAPWYGTNHADRTRNALETLLPALPKSDLCWGGDWNHAFSGPEYAGSRGGRTALAEAIARRNLSVPTSDLPHALDGLLSIDHIAVPTSWEVLSAEQVSATIRARRLSDHDMYVVNAAAPEASLDW